jgi:hypothetical protein
MADRFIIIEIFETTPIWISIIIFGSVYISLVIALNYLLKKSIVNNFDPLRIYIFLFIGPYLTGYLIVPFFTGVFTTSFIIISFFIVTWLIVTRMIGRPRQVNLRDAMRPEFQSLILTFAALFMVGHIIVNMIIPGKTPLFSEGGIHTRFESTENSRIFTWLYFSSNNIGGLMYAVTENMKIRKYAGFVFLIQIASWILFASKGAFIILIINLIFVIFISQVRGDKRRSKYMKRLTVGLSIIILLIMPIYLTVIGFSGEHTENSVMLLLANRFFNGFDQLIPAASLDLASQAEPQSLLGANLFECQFMTFVKVFFGKEFPYYQIGQYVIEAQTGSLMDKTYTFPNSNLILEAIFTSGYILGFYLFLFELVLFYSLRYIALIKPISPMVFFLIGGFVLTPVTLFLAGQEWCTNTAFFGINVFTCWVISELIIKVRRLMKKDKLYKYSEGIISTQ